MPTDQHKWDQKVASDRNKLESVEDIKIKTICVTQRGNKYYYPPSIPKERSNLTKILSILTCLVLFAVDYFTNNFDIYIFLVFYSCGFLGNFVLHLLYRAILIVEEFKHVISRYKNSYMTLFNDAFTFPKSAIAAFVIILFGICVKGINGIFPLTVNGNLLFCYAPTIFLLGKVFELNNSPLNSSLQISQINGLDYGSGMAYSFFNGYLKLVTQKNGAEDKDLRELMEIYEDKHNIEFQAYKLFILIPTSLRCFVSLKNDFSPLVDESHTLPEKKITVAGVQNRVYKNAVYKISCGNGKKVYVSAEYASPLKTFEDVVISAGDNAVYYKKLKNEITLQFYLTLKKILEDPKYGELCELIFFEDSYRNKENQTCYHDVGKVLLARLKEMRRYPRKKIEKIL